MDASAFEILASIVGIVALIEFFHIGYLVSVIRKESKNQTKLMMLSSGYLIGKTATMYGPDVPGGYSNEGTIYLLGESWKCVSVDKIKTLTKVRVAAVDWNALTVTAIES